MIDLPEPLWGHWYLGERLYQAPGTEVYALTRRDGIGRSCVVKCITLDASDQAGLERVQAECRNQERMADCGHVAAILDDLVLTLPGAAGQPERTLVLLRQERLDCLEELMREGQRFSPAEVRKIGQDLCQALIYAQRLNIVHRDIKPANVYRSAGGQYKLSDFGISALTDQRELKDAAGTAAYLAPEIASGGTASAQSDICSLGLLLYQLLNDNLLPFTEEGSTYDQIQSAIAGRLRGQTVPPLRCADKALERAVLRACAPDPRQRWHSAEELLRALSEKTTAPPRRALLPLLLGLLLGVAAGWLLGSGALSSAAQPAPATGTDAVAAVERVIVDGDDEANSVTHRYEVIRQPLTWEDARIWCEARGGHLATVTSADEAKSLQRLVDQAGLEAAWLGANNRNASVGFQWLTDEEFAYAEWGVNEPNNSNGDEHYLMLQKRGDQGWVWNDSSMDGLSLFDTKAVGFVCEWEEAAL